MKRGTITIRGRVYLTLETVAECYEVEVSWIREVYEIGLLGPGESVEGSVAIAGAMLDRLGEILRLHRQQGVNLAGIARLLAERSDHGAD